MEGPLYRLLISFLHQDEIRKFYNGPSRDTSYQVSIHLPKPFERRTFFRNKPFRNKNRLWWPCLLMDRDKMSNLYRGPSIDASYTKCQFNYGRILIVITLHHIFY
jgi:hypothetical protein